MITALGKFLRNLRIDRGEYLKDMADKLSVTSSFLSAVENGKKSAPASWVDQIVMLYDLPAGERNELEIAFYASKDSVTLSLSDLSPSQKDLCIAFARRFDALDERSLEAMSKLLKR